MPNSEYAPDAIRQLYDRFHALNEPSELSGILGDRAHTFGFHRARAVLPRSDYSVVAPGNQKGDAWAASALDVKLTPEGMKVVSARLRAAMRKADVRVAALFEFGGTLNGTVTFSRNIYGQESWNEWDDSHLWHVHLSIIRAFANDYAAIAGIADVMAGKRMTAKQWTATKRRQVTMRRNGWIR